MPIPIWVRTITICYSEFKAPARILDDIEFKFPDKKVDAMVPFYVKHPARHLITHLDNLIA